METSTSDITIFISDEDSVLYKTFLFLNNELESRKKKFLVHEYSNIFEYNNFQDKKIPFIHVIYTTDEISPENIHLQELIDNVLDGRMFGIMLKVN